MKNLSKFLLVISMMIYANFLVGQQRNFLSYSLQDGLPQSQVYAIAQDGAGFLWVGTQGGGLARFDGNSFERIALPLSDKYINAMISTDHAMWIGSNTALTVSTKDTTYHVQWPDGVAQKVTALSVDNQGVVWVGTEKGLYFVDTKKTPFRLRKYKKLKNANVRSFFFSEKEQWVATNVGAWQLNGEGRYSIQNGLESNDVHVVFRDILGRLWVATFDGRISLFDTEQNISLGAIKIPKGGHPQLIEQVDDQIWVGTINNGIAVYDVDTRNWTFIDERVGLAAKNIKILFRDSWDNQWLGTSGDGLLKMVGQEFVHFGLQAGLKGDNIYSVFRDHQSRIWFSESAYGVSVFDNLGLHHFGAKEGFANVKCKAILEDGKGRIWLGTDGRGLAYRDTSGFHFLTEKQGLPSNWINSTVLDSLGHIWVGTYGNGIAKIVDRDSLGFHVFPYGKAEGLPELKIQTLKIDNEGHLWFATRGGVVGYYENDFDAIIFNQDNGLPNAAIRTIDFYEQRVWVGTAGHGIYFADWSQKPVRFAKAKVSKDVSFEQMSKNIYLLKFDNSGNLWVGTERGLNRLKLNHRSQVIDYQYFGLEEGFVGIETCQNSICEGVGNDLWIGTMNGLMKYQLTKESQAINPPTVHFDDIQLFYKSLAETDYRNWSLSGGGIKNGLVLPYNKNHLGFRLSGVNLARPNKVKYRWQLAGSETEWSPLFSSNSVNYANLDPGSYVFKAQTCIDLTNCSPIITASFTIEHPYWETWWFRALVGFGVLLFAFLFYWFRVKAIRRQEQAKRKELELRNHLLTVEQKALQLQMNPHFIFNALNSINGLVAMKDFAQARKQINRFAVLMRQILSNSRKETISLEEEKKTLENYLTMEQFCRADVFEFDILMSEGLDVEEIEVPPMIIQPFVENAIIHGVSHLDKKGKIRIDFYPQGEMLICEITDNGVGRKKSAELRKKRSPSHQSTAMAVTKERLDALFAERRGKSIEITDIVDANGAVKGTKVTLRIPI